LRRIGYSAYLANSEMQDGKVQETHFYLHESA
jgi:hypothetical protein